jgi:hypothetical protein
MTADEKNQLIDHLDETLRGRDNAYPGQMIPNDPEAGMEWNYLQLAVEAVREAGLYQQVSAAKTAWKAGAGTAAHSTTTDKATNPVENSKVRNLYRYSVRAAAVILIITTSTAVYKYLSVSSTSLYDRYYGGYHMSTARGAGESGPMTDAYNAKDWTTVRQLASTAKNRTNQTDFLAGMACLEQRQYDEAIGHFEQIIAVNTHAGTDLYQDEAEYYLAISWLAHRNVNEAMPLLEKIRADQQHKFHEKVESMSFFDLRLAQYKENK